MEVWQEVLKVALIGTERQAPAFASSEEPVGRLLAELNGEEYERTLLRVSGILAVYRRAGYLPSQAVEALPLPAEAEEKPSVPAEVMQDLTVMMSGEYREALPEWMQTATERGWRVAEAHLVELLEFGRGHPESRDALLPLLGKRGRWLATQNPDWKYALRFSLAEIEDVPDIEDDGAADTERLWQTGTKEERVALLHRLRRSAPAQARTLVESTWKQDASAERAEFVATFAAGLSMEDEPFLENTLDDKRKEARKAAQDLLTCLPDSRLCQRMWERARALVQLQTAPDTTAKPEAAGSLWERFKYVLQPKSIAAPAEIITVELPQACDKAMIRDGVEAKPSYSSIGEKTWWLTEILKCIPLSRWSKEWARPPSAIVAANRSPEWQRMLLESWTGALRNGEDDQDWAMALFACWGETAPNHLPVDVPWNNLLPPDVLETGILNLLDAAGQEIQFGNPAFALLTRYHVVWSVPLTRSLLTKLSGLEGNSYYIASSIGAYAPFIPSDLRAEFFAVWSKLAEKNTYLQGQMERSLALDAFRIEMRRKMDAAALQEN